MSKYIYGVAHGRNGQWEAFSFDFDLAVQGHSFEEVSDRLHEAVKTYIATAMEQPEPARSKLLQRTAPLRVRAVWTLKIALWTMFHKKRTEESAFGFPVSCPA
jgi:predicted RNase H-like HicB family nuclease